MTPKKANLLINEKSPYLLQHAHNPVNWYPWSEVAFEKATKDDKPIFLSIGYSACHWCHVMERESFEDQDIADILNEKFVSIKVDREERPDIDSTYMGVCQMMTGSGGWPLTIIMRPDKKPFFAGTYLPKEGRFGIVGLRLLLTEIADAWKLRRAEVDRVAETATSTIRRYLTLPKEVTTLDRGTLDSFFLQMRESYDAERGGFGPAPKFPMSHRLISLLRYWRRTENSQAIDMVVNTLLAMRRGGIWDHVGYGFHRYSTDRGWLVPHFEKMLYDQALMIMAYSEGYEASGRWEFGKTVEEIVRYVERDMMTPSGAFCSAEDADSEGVEGKFYVWTESEINDVLGGEADSVIEIFNIAGEGNFVEESTGRRTGSNILHLTDDYDELAKRMGMETPDAYTEIDTKLRRLREARERRERPLRDDKILTEWNGLMIAALARASRALDSPRYLEMAERSARFILDEMRVDGLRHRYREGAVSEEVFLQDYSFLIWGLIELYQTSFELEWLEQSLELIDEMIERFWDDESGWFQLTPRGSERMIFHRMDSHDGAIPSGNSVSFLDLLTLSMITGRSEMAVLGERLSDSLSSEVVNDPPAHSLFLNGLDLAIGPSSQVVIVGDPESIDTRRMVSELRSRYLPRNVVLLKKEGTMEDIVPYTKEMRSKEGRTTAYLCTGGRCLTPTNSIDELLGSLDQISAK